jgi:hypothetical protein
MIEKNRLTIGYLFSILSGMATSIGTMFGKLGALIGNILTGIFIDVNCIVPITFSCLFLISKYKTLQIPIIFYRSRS